VAGRPKSNLIKGFPRAETTGSLDAYQAAKDAGVSAPAKALLIGFIGNQGQVPFQRFGMSGDSGQQAARVLNKTYSFNLITVAL
jgi:hypothetical protein